MAHPYGIDGAAADFVGRAADIARGHEAYRELPEVMDQRRRRRLQHAGFTPGQAQALSDLHTPNFM